MIPASHFGSFVAALALGLALTAVGGMAYVASAPTIPAQDVIKEPVRAHTTASTLHTARVTSLPIIRHEGRHGTYVWGVPRSDASSSVRC
jgi:hypothetical protein